MKPCLLFPLAALTGCADITPIEHQRQYGPVTTLLDGTVAAPISYDGVAIIALFVQSGLEDAISAILKQTLLVAAVPRSEIAIVTLFVAVVFTVSTRE